MEPIGHVTDHSTEEEVRRGSRSWRICPKKPPQKQTIHTRISLARAVVSLHIQLETWAENFWHVQSGPGRYAWEATTGMPAKDR